MARRVLYITYNKASEGDHREAYYRDRERAKEFDARFIELARSVYYANDGHAAAKKELNVHLGSAIVEEKSLPGLHLTTGQSRHTRPPPGPWQV